MWTLPLSGETVLCIPLSLPRGLTTVVLVVDEGRGELDAREPVTVARLAPNRPRQHPRTSASAWCCWAWKIDSLVP